MGYSPWCCRVVHNGSDLVCIYIELKNSGVFFFFLITGTVIKDVKFVSTAKTKIPGFFYLIFPE